MYKDKEKQREAQRNWVRQKRASKGSTEQGSTKGVTGSCCIDHEHNFTGEIVKPKRGKDIKCFEDLPPDVQKTINRLSTLDGKIDQAIKAKRTAAAIKYQHLFPDRYEPGQIEVTRAGAVVMGNTGLSRTSSTTGAKL